MFSGPCHRVRNETVPLRAGINDFLERAPVIESAILRRRGFAHGAAPFQSTRGRKKKGDVGRAQYQYPLTDAAYIDRKSVV